jgi:hypothetical protein
MYYLRKEPYEKTIAKIEKTDGTVIPERKYMIEDRAIYKHHDFSRFYRGEFKGIDGKYQGMKLYKCKTLKNILKLQETTFNYSGEIFDIYDENGKISTINTYLKSIELCDKRCEYPDIDYDINQDNKKG